MKGFVLIGVSILGFLIGANYSERLFLKMLPNYERAQLNQAEGSYLRGCLGLQPARQTALRCHLEAKVHRKQIKQIFDQIDSQSKNAAGN